MVAQALVAFVSPSNGATRACAPFVLAISAAAAALIAPPLALLALAALAACVMMRGGDSLRIDLAGLAGPCFAAILVGAFTGLAGAIGVIFVWRVISDTRWSVAEATRLALASGRPQEARWSALLHAWATPLYGVTLVAFTAPHMVAGLPLDLPHVPMWVPVCAGALAAGALFDWILRRAADWRLGELAAAPTLHLAAHHSLFLLAFGFGLDVSAGIVAMLAWRLAHAAAARAAQPSLTAVP